MTRVAIALALGLATGFAGCDKGKAEAVQTIPPHDGSSDPGEENVAAAVTIADAMTYIPDGANFVFGLDAARVGASKPMKDILDLPLYGHADELIAATQACKIATSTWNYAFVAGDMSDEGGLMVVVSALVSWNRTP